MTIFNQKEGFNLVLMYLLTVFFMKVYIKLRIKWLLTSCLASFLWWLSV